MLDEIINYVQSLQRQVEVWSLFNLQKEGKRLKAFHLMKTQRTDQMIQMLVYPLSKRKWFPVHLAVPIHEACGGQSTARPQHRRDPVKRCIQSTHLRVLDTFPVWICKRSASKLRNARFTYFKMKCSLFASLVLLHLLPSDSHCRSQAWSRKAFMDWPVRMDSEQSCRSN